MAKYKGLLVSVYRSHHGDCTSGGISSKAETLILIGPGIPGIFEGDETNTVELKWKFVGGNEYKYVVPVVGCPSDKVGPMAGGNFVYTSDSRFPGKYPLSIHDRFEVQH